jgi:hypothetical protein
MTENIVKNPMIALIIQPTKPISYKYFFTNKKATAVAPAAAFPAKH